MTCSNGLNEKPKEQRGLNGLFSFAYISYPFMEVYDMDILSAIFGFGACIAIIGFMAWMIVDAVRVVKYGLEGDEDDE